LLVSDLSEFEFLPLCQTLGKTAVYNLIELNLKWQKEIFEHILELTGNKNSPDLMIFTNRQTKYSGVSIKKYCRREFPHLRLNVQAMPDSRNPRDTFSPVQSTFSKTPASVKMTQLVEELSQKYDEVTVWNLESPALAPAHFTEIFANLAGTGSMYILTSARNRLILLSCPGAGPGVGRKTVDSKIPALYDMESLPDIIAGLRLQNSGLSKRRAGELAEAMNVIRRELR